jgi:hypothetical protein
MISSFDILRSSACRWKGRNEDKAMSSLSGQYFSRFSAFGLEMKLAIPD